MKKERAKRLESEEVSLSIKISHEMYNALNAQAKREYTSMASVIKKSVERYIKEVGNGE